MKLTGNSNNIGSNYQFGTNIRSYPHISYFLMTHIINTGVFTSKIKSYGVLVSLAFSQLYHLFILSTEMSRKRDKLIAQYLVHVSGWSLKPK